MSYNEVLRRTLVTMARSAETLIRVERLSSIKRVGEKAWRVHAVT